MAKLTIATALTALALLTTAHSPPAASFAASPELPQTPSLADPSVFDAVAPEACESWPTRVFVRTKYGTECVEFYTSPMPKDVSVAVFNFHGDFVETVLNSPNGGRSIMGHLNRSADAAAAKYGIPFINISRPGVLLSTGNHFKRREPKEFASMNAAIDMIKERYGIEKIALAGQSGGGSIVGGLLALGRTDIVCAVPGSGAFDLPQLAGLRAQIAGKPYTEEDRKRYSARFFSPAENVQHVVADAARRIFVIGDPRDQNTYFVQQREFAERLQTAGHHARVLYAPAADKLRHGVTQFAVDVAGLCAIGTSDTEIEAIMSNWWRREIMKPVPRPAPVSGPAQDHGPRGPMSLHKPSDKPE